VQVPDEGSPPPELARAEAFIQKEDYAAAEPLLRKVIADDAASGNPANYVAWFELGFVESGLGKTDESITAYRKSVEAKPDVFESNLNLGLQLAKTQQPDAEKFLRAATVLKPAGHVAEGQFRAWLSLGHVLEATKPEEALAAYHQAALLQPKDAEPRLSAGLVFEKQQKYGDAEREYKEALALGASDAASIDAITGLANIYMRGRRLPEAKEYLQKLIVLHPDSAGAHIQLGQILSDEGKNEEALAELQTGVKLAPTDVPAQRGLADLYLTMKKYDQAEAAYRGLLAGSPKDAELHNDLGKALLEQKKFPEAQKEFVAAVTLKQDFGEAYGNLAFAASANKDYPLTIKALDARAKMLPETAITYFWRATAYDNLWQATGHSNSRDRKEAIGNYRLFLNTANGKYPDQEWQAKHRLIAIEPKR
jgi:tetratricopeptide (TPR) repeat protein